MERDDASVGFRGSEYLTGRVEQNKKVKSWGPGKGDSGHGRPEPCYGMFTDSSCIRIHHGDKAV